MAARGALNASIIKRHDIMYRQRVAKTGARSKRRYRRRMARQQQRHGGWQRGGAARGAYARVNETSASQAAVKRRGGAKRDGT